MTCHQNPGPGYYSVLLVIYLFLYLFTSVTPVQDSTGISSFAIILLILLLSPIFLSIPTCYRMICRGRRLTPSPTNNTHTKCNIVKPSPLYVILHFACPHQNIGSTRRIDTMHLYKRLHVRWLPAV
jgi:hypothetical protein